jgi:hypothetical protein
MHISSLVLPLAALGIGSRAVEYVPLLLCIAAAVGGGYLYMKFSRRDGDAGH